MYHIEMATSDTRSTVQARLGGQYEVLEYELGDLLDVRWSGRCRKVALRECPFCATDPTRPRYRFGKGEDRATHFFEQH